MALYTKYPVLELHNKTKEWKESIGTPQQNKRVERKHRYILNVVRELLFQASLLIKFWGKAILIATHVINLTPTKILNGRPHTKCCLERNQRMTNFVFLVHLVLCIGMHVIKINSDQEADIVCFRDTHLGRKVGEFMT